MPLETKLRYLFTAGFADGHSIIQRIEDVSSIDPSKSQFFDVLEHAKISPITLFCLTPLDSFRRNIVGVNLKTGRFFDGYEETEPQPDSKPLPPGGVFELIYLRDHTATLELETGEQTDRHRYRLGWNYKLGDKVWTQTLVFD